MMEQQIREMTLSIADYEEKKQKLEIDLRASVDKVFDLREIITELEQQNESKSKNEHILTEKIKTLDSHIQLQTNKNSSLQDEVDSLKHDITSDYHTKICHLEEQLRNMRSSAEQSLLIDQMTGQLKEIECTLDRKTKMLEQLHAKDCSASCSSPSEDVSVHGGNSGGGGGGDGDGVGGISSAAQSPRSPRSLPIDDVQRVMDKLVKHNRAEEAAIKRIHDFEMQMVQVKDVFMELQRERDMLQEKMTEQMLRITSLQSRLDEQRIRAEELQRQGTADLNVKNYELQEELKDIREKLSSREKQIVQLKEHLEHSKVLIDRLESETETDGNSKAKIAKLEETIVAKSNEILRLKEKMRTEMINKLALPDLMETMLADKNDEIDHLKEQLKAKQVDLQMYLDERPRNESDANDGKSSGRTLSDIISLSELDDLDIARRAPDAQAQQDLNILSIDQSQTESAAAAAKSTPKLFAMIESNVNLTQISLERQTSAAAAAAADVGNLTMLKSGSTAQPCKINFSLTGDESDRASTTQQKTQKSINIDEQLQNIDALNAEIDRLRCDNAEKSDQIKELHAKLDQNAEIQLDLTAKNKMLIDLSNEKKALQIEMDNLKLMGNRLEDTQQELAFVRSVLLEKEDELSQLLAQKLIDAKDVEGDANNDAKLQIKIDALNAENDQLKEQINVLDQQISTLNHTISHKDELLSKHEKNSLNLAQIESKHLEQIKQLRNEFSERSNDMVSRQQYDAEMQKLKDNLEMAKNELFEKMIEYEKSQLYLKQQEQMINELKDRLNGVQQKNSPRNADDYRAQIHYEQMKCKKLESEIEQLKRKLDELEATKQPTILDEMASRVEKELNYSAQLDSNIRKAIESDELNSDDDVVQLLSTVSPDHLIQEFQLLRQKLQIERKTTARLQSQLDAQKDNSFSIQEQDANVIESINQRLEATLNNEVELQKQLEAEQMRNERLNTQIVVFQRTLSRDTSLSLKSPPESPRLRASRVSDFESEMANRLQSEIKLLTAQNERERERIADHERVMEREKSRFEKELADRKDYGEQMKKEADRLLKEKESLEDQLEHAQERLSLSSREIESLESRLVSLQEAETRRATVRRRDNERIESTHLVVEMQELKLRLNFVEKERDKLQEKLFELRGDLERSAQREAQLTNALAKEQDGATVPRQFMQKLNNMNSLIVDNTRENRQLSETLQILTAERQTLQQRIVELESKLRSSNFEELEERSNHLFGKYLRVESYRKALVHQKKYLQISLQTYQENEAKALSIINASHPPPSSRRKPKSFRSAVLVIIAIERMKYIVRRWQVGRRVVSRAMFPQQQHQIPRRSASASTNNWVPPMAQSPPIRDRSSYFTRSAATTTTPSSQLPIRPLQSPSLIAECSERLESLASRSRWS